MGSAISAYKGSTVTIHNSSIDTTTDPVASALEVFNNSSLSIDHSSVINSSSDAVLLFDNLNGDNDDGSVGRITNSLFDKGTIAFEIFGNVRAGIDNTIIKNFSESGLASYNQEANIAVTNSTITDNNYGLELYNTSNITIATSSIYNNSGYGLFAPNGHAIARNNWWGDATGPLNTISNSSGRVMKYPTTPHLQGMLNLRHG